MLFTADPLDQEETEVLEKIRRLKERFGVGRTSSRWFGFLRRNAFARAIRGSNSIEGFNVTVDDAMAAVAEEEPIDPKTEAWAAIIGYRMAMTLVLQKADDPYFAYSCEFINALHFMMLGYDLAKRPGLWRTGTIYVHDNEEKEVVYEGPDIEIVPELMADLIDYLNLDDGTPPLVRAAMGHLNLVLIHPFSDGNGRMARCLQTLILARAWGNLGPFFVSIEEYLGHTRNTRGYYDVLAQVARGSWQPENGTRPWIRFCLTAQFRQATTLWRRSRYIRQLFDLMESEVTKRGLPERAATAVAEASMHYRIRNATYRKSVDVSAGVASRDLKSLVTAGFLSPRGERRGRFYIASPTVFRLASRISRPKRAGDPFADQAETNRA